MYSADVSREGRSAPVGPVLYLSNLYSLWMSLYWRFCPVDISPLIFTESIIIITPYCKLWLNAKDRVKRAVVPVLIIWSSKFMCIINKYLVPTSHETHSAVYEDRSFNTLSNQESYKRHKYTLLATCEVLFNVKFKTVCTYIFTTEFPRVSCNRIMIDLPLK